MLSTRQENFKNSLNNFGICIFVISLLGFTSFFFYLVSAHYPFDKPGYTRLPSKKPTGWTDGELNAFIAFSFIFFFGMVIGLIHLSKYIFDFCHSGDVSSQ